jgi:hypothetical protein
MGCSEADIDLRQPALPRVSPTRTRARRPPPTRSGLSRVLSAPLHDSCERESSFSVYDRRSDSCGPYDLPWERVVRAKDRGGVEGLRMCDFSHRVIKTTRDIIAFAESAGATVEQFDEVERWRLMQAWRGLFARAVWDRYGKWVHRGYHWHAFSSGLVPAKHGARALQLYLAERVTTLLVLPEDEGGSGLSCRVVAPVDFSPLRLDLLVAPPSLEWTIVFTHEQPELGPYYSRSEWL